MNKQVTQLVSIIVPVYNVEKVIEKCISSLINQTYNNIEIILVDDGSTDNSYEICKNYKCQDERIKVIHKENGGVSSARNVGLSKSNGNYVTFVDADDYVEKEYIKELVNIADGKADFVLSEPEIIKNNKKIIDNKKEIVEVVKNKNELIESCFYENRKYNWICTIWCKLYKRSIIKNNNLKFNTDLRLYEDCLFNLEYIILCENIIYTNKKYYNYVIYNNSSSREIKTNINDDLDSVFELINEFFQRDKLNIKLDNFKIRQLDLYFSKFAKNNLLSYSMIKASHKNTLFNSIKYDNVNPKQLTKKRKILFYLYKNNFNILIYLMYSLYKIRRKLNER